MNAHVKGTGGEGMYSHVMEDNLMLRVLVGEGMYPHVVEDNLMLRVLVGEGMYPHIVEDNLTLSSGGCCCEYSDGMVLQGPHNQVNVCGHQMRQKECKNLTSKITLCLHMQGCSCR